MNSACRRTERGAPGKSPSGFTLIEVLIALFILVLIGTTTSKAVIDAAKLKEVLKRETDFSSEFRTATAFIERDLSQTFNPRWFLSPDLIPIDPYNPPPPPPPPAPGMPPPLPVLGADEINRKTRGMAFQAFEYWGPVLDASGIRASRFQGKESQMSFVSASHARVYQMKRESIYAKIRYELRRQEEDGKATDRYTLVKIENTRAFELEEQKDAPFLATYEVLGNIKKLKFLYYKAGEKDPVREWDSEATEPKGKFPVAIEMEATLVGPDDRVFESRVFFNLEAPNDVLPKTY